MSGVGVDAPYAGELPFTDAARRLLAEARRESDRLQHEYVGTEHLVLAMTHEPSSSTLLSHLGVDRERVRVMLTEIVRRGSAAPAPELVRPYTSKTKKAFSLASESARAFGQTSIGIEHLLVGLLRERTNIGAQVLHELGVTAERALDCAATRPADAQ
jgi:ATP-dependent Clp protease ATP-binding subunit ClpC